MDLPAELARRTLDALTLNLAVLDSAGVIIASNSAWQQFGNFNGVPDPTDSVGQNYLQVTEEADDEHARRAAAGLRAVLEGDSETFRHEYPCHSKTENRWFLMHVSRFEADDAGYVVVAHENITARKQAEIEVERRNEELEAFARLLSHDLRSPLNVARGHADLLREETDSESLELVQSALTRMDTLVDEALTLLQSEVDTVELTDLSLQSVAEQAWAHVETKEATLEIASTRTLRADSGLLTHVFENLFGNAVDHAGREAVVTVGTLDDGFYVEDDGRGIADQNHEDIFEIGFTTSADGTGFGLGIVRHIVENHGWEVEAKTGRTGGARFEIHTQPASPEPTRQLSQH